MTSEQADARDSGEGGGLPARSGAEAQAWDEAVLAELLALDDTDSVVLTNTAGEALCAYSRDGLRHDAAEVLDVALGALARLGEGLSLGAPVLLATRYARAWVVAALGPAVHAVVLAKGDANLGRLLLLLRQLLVVAP